MTKRDDLIALRDAVTAGGVGWNTIANMCEEAGIAAVSAQHAAEAYTGSLDAALRLHKALLPGWQWSVHDDGAYVIPKAGVVHGTIADVPARAWLLAILEALIAQEDASASD